MSCFLEKINLSLFGEKKTIHADFISMMDNNREQCCRAIAIWMLVIQSTEGASVEWPASMRSHSRRHLAPIPAMRQPVAATALLSHDQCRSEQKTDIRSEIIIYNLNV